MFIIFILLFVFLFQPANAAQDNFYERSIYNNEYGLSIYPSYPPKIGDTVTLRIRTFKPAQKLSVFTDREQEIPMSYSKGHWWGKYTIPTDYQEGPHFFTVWVRYPFSPAPEKGLIAPIKKLFGMQKRRANAFWSKSQIWYQAFYEPISSTQVQSDYPPFVERPDLEEPLPMVTGEAVSFDVIGPDPGNLIIKGSQLITFKSRSLIGSKEGYTAGSSQSREETLRLNITGTAQDISIDANLFRSSGVGLSAITDKEEKISILMKKGSFEAYLGDFNADLNDTEFTKLNRMLSGGRIKGDLGFLNFNLLYSSPKGEAKFVRMYGDNSQGPFALGSAPAVIDSERVYVDGVLQKRGDDYTIDYQAATITFIKKVIDIKSILNIYYDHRQTVYQHATYGLRTVFTPNDYFDLGATYLDDSDSLAGAAVIRNSMSQEAVNPAGHYVVGLDSSIDLDNFDADAEIAYSYNDLNLLSSGSEESGKAGKLSLSFGLGPFDVTAKAKRVGTKFFPIADPDPKQAVTEYAGVVAFRPFTGFGANTSYEYLKYLQDSVVYENTYKTSQASLNPEYLPSLQYVYSQNCESNDPVTGNVMLRAITRNSLDSTFQWGFLTASARGAKETWVRQSPSEEVTDYDRANVGLATIGLEKITLASNVELEERKDPDLTRASKKSYNLNLTFSPIKQYMLSSNVQVIEDTKLGNTSVIDMACKFEPFNIIKLEGKYTINTLLDSFPVTQETVSKQSGSFLIDFRPFSFVRWRYLLKPNFTKILRTSTLSYNNEQTQNEINYLPFSEMMLGWLNKKNSGFNVLNTDYPNYTVKNNTQDSDSTLYTFKYAPIRIFSIELNFLNDNLSSLTLYSTAEPYGYTKGTGKNNKFDATIKTSMSEKFSFDTSYSFQKSDQGSGEAVSNVLNTKTHTLSLKGIWNVSDAWTLSVSGAYIRTTDYLLQDLTYTLTPGCGFIYRYLDRLRIDLDASYAKSYSGSETEKINYSLRGKYTLSTFVDVLMRLDQEIGYSPDYRLTDITGNIQINL